MLRERVKHDQSWQRDAKGALTAFALGAVFAILTATLTATGEEEYTKPISNPFGDAYGTGADKNRTILFRGKNLEGQSVEVELPQGEEKITDLVLPMKDTVPGSDLAARRRELPQSYQGEKPTYTDREIASRMPRNSPEDEWTRQKVEGDLGLGAAEDSTPQQEASYLAGVDTLRQLFRTGRYEAALIEADKMIRLYPTDPRLHEMRGTLLDRLGYHDLALDSWNESLKFRPANRSLQKYVERKTLIYRKVSGLKAPAAPAENAPKGGGK